MEIKNFAKAIGTYFFAEILCLFLALTLSAIGGGLARLISCICTIGILVCLCINFAFNRAKADQHQKIDGTVLRRFLLSGAVTLPYVIWGICLLLARGGILPGTFYRWYKLLTAPFLQLCNLFSADVTAAALSWGEAGILVLADLLPFVVVWLTYTLTRRGFAPEELLYRKK